MAEMKVHYILPLKWSLHYVMTEGEWQAFRKRIKQVTPGWEKCSCPKGCKTSDLDEEWQYDRDNHVKRLVTAKFICSGCHWLKTPPWRIDTWLKQAKGTMPVATKPPHIITCLGWTQAQVDDLRQKDLALHELETREAGVIHNEVALGLAEIRYWTADLSALNQFGYSAQHIAQLERKMNNQ
jgi:hypothetical protein